MARIGAGDVELTTDDLRVVVRYAVESAAEVLPLFEQWHPDDRRPRAAIDAAWAFVDGATRSRLQRVTAVDAHRAAKLATSGAALDTSLRRPSPDQAHYTASEERG
ncbi:MAG: putative immunity protein [Pseudonocardia sp.]